ncbi:MAG: iron ABC transporter permease [Scytolyngbya sp. HA4215-MV1]|jgi:iron(III) transport system permease protein|nr:iron ABC transporter permease [Scytolyngbya sp. HA4215-MV1]
MQAARRWLIHWFDRQSGWTGLVVAISVLLSLPVLGIFAGIFTDARDVWEHLAATVLSVYLSNSFWLMVGVGVGTATIGTSTAWLVAMCRFPGRRIFAWALLLPLAAPAYILAYTYTDLLDYYGPVQSGLRQWLGWQSAQDYWFPNVRSLWGAIVMLTLVLYPYVYLLARTAFLNQSLCTLEVSRSLGCNPWQSFFTVALPMARPAIMAGLSLALMETLNDFATVQFFGVDTFTTGIYRTWFGMNERLAATQLAAFLLAFVFGLVLLERVSRGQARYYQTASQQHLSGYRLSGVRAIGSSFICFLPIYFGFFLPGQVLLQLAWENPAQTFDHRFWGFAHNSLILAGLTVAISVVIAVGMAYGQRLYPNQGMRVSTQMAAMGYALPGSVIAVGILIPIGKFDNAIDAAARSFWGVSTGLLFSGTVTALVFAYLVRFLAVALSSVEASLTQIRPSLDDAARSLGHGPTSTLIQVHAPLLGGGILTAATLVFVEVMKELPATLIVRPFNFDTLAIRVYNLAADERLAESAGSALAIVLVGLIPVIFLSNKISSSSK